jgi:hypothetical protein
VVSLPHHNGLTVSQITVHSLIVSVVEHIQNKTVLKSKQLQQRLFEDYFPRISQFPKPDRYQDRFYSAAGCCWLLAAGCCYCYWSPLQLNKFRYYSLLRSHCQFSSMASLELADCPW